MKSNHDGDCSIYASLVNRNPEDGICNCGYGLQELRKSGDKQEMYSEEKKEVIKQKINGGLEKKIK